MTRDDAEELVQILVDIGRRQTQDALADLEGLVERSAEQTRKRTQLADSQRRRCRAPRAGHAIARCAPSTAPAARPASGTAFPVLGYDDLTAAQVDGTPRGA